MATMNGIDISKWQKGLDLSKIKCDFVIVKATEGIGYVDPECDKFYQQAKKLGKKLGFYHFARPTANNDAVKEAQFFYNNTKNYFGEAIPVLDWEAENKQNTAWAKRWLDEVYRLSGVKPIIYMSESVANAYNWAEVVNGDYGLWVAKYSDNVIDYNYDMSKAGTKPKVNWWKFYAMWQWTSSGRLDGYNGNLDCDVFYGDTTAWDKYAGKKTTTPVIPEEPKDIEKLEDTVDLMVSDDWKERFKAEYWQLKLRYERLKYLVDNWDALDFTPSSDKATHIIQLDVMKAYIDILETRAEKESVAL